jgi:Ca2+-transporting ATPase
LALRENDPNAARHAHLRHPSITSVFTDASGDAYNRTNAIETKLTNDSGTKTANVASSDEGGATKSEQQQKVAISKEADDAIEKNASWFKRMTANFKGATRQGRLAAQAKVMEDERQKRREMDPTPFRIRPIELADLVDPKSVELLESFGGISGLLASLGTDGERGLDLVAPSGDGSAVEERKPVAKDDLEASASKQQNEKHSFVRATQEDRQRVYGENVLPEKKSKSLLLLMWLALQDKILILLCVAAVVSLALGLYVDLGAPPELVECLNPPPGQERCEVPSVDWVEGVAILVAVAIVDIVGSLNDWQKERQFRKLNAKKEERDVKVIRSGKRALLSVHQVQVGDILEVEPGEILPCDGVFLRGHNVKCDESGATGESDMIRKVTYDECLSDWENHKKTGEKIPHRDCFLISGSRCLEGTGEYLVTAVGPMSFHGKLMMALRTDGEMTPLQAKLNRLAEIIAYAGTTAGVLLFIALMIKFFVQLANPRPWSPRTPDEKAQTFIDILISAVVIIVVAVPEGLPLATTLALAFATKRMTKENLLVRLLSACETSANCSVICTDKTGTLTQNEMTVVAGSVGAHMKFARDLEQNRSRIESKADSGANKDWSIEQRELNKVITGPLRELFNDAIAVNSSAFEEDEKAHSIREDSKRSWMSRITKVFASKKAQEAVEAANGLTNRFVGSKTETALLGMAKELEWQDYREARSRNEVLNSYPFSSERKAMAVVVRKPDGGCRLFVKGASEVLMKLCEQHVDVDAQTGDYKVIPFTEDTRQNVAKTIIFYANQMLRTLAICYKDFPSWPPQEAETDADGAITYESLARDMSLIAIVGIEDPLRPSVRNAVATCAKAGVQVKMCTGDNALTARSIATQCGIFTSGGLIMEGPMFRQLNESDMMMIVPRLQVLARCSPEDKKVLVECLKRLDHVVGVTGDGTNDAPALKTANVGFSMGIAGTEVAREASDIILMDDNFQSIVTAIMWGRSVNDAVKRFLQFQLSVNIGAVGITFISAVASREEQAVFTAVQLLWINLIMDTLAALALATDPASPDLLDRKPDRRDAPLLSTDMWKMIIGQSIYQFALILTFNFAGEKLLRMDGPVDPITDRQNHLLLRALIFNLYVWCQLFNQVNCRSLTRELNIFKGLHRNLWFIGIICIEVALQVLISFKGGAAFSVVPLGGREWAISIVGGLISWPIGVLIRLIPTKPIDIVLMRFGLMPDPKALPKHRKRTPTEVEADADKVDWDEPALGQLAQKLGAFARVRGGRSRLAFIGKTRGQRLRDQEIHPRNLMALVPAIIGAGIVGNWHPANPPEASRSAPAAGDPSLSSWQLYQGGKIQVHPETSSTDEFVSQLKEGGHTAPPVHKLR